MAQPKPAATAGTVPINITYNETTQTYSMSPANPHIDHGGTAQFNATNKPCTIFFNPTNTPFGASQTVQTSPNLQIGVGNGNFTVGYCITTVGGQCTAPPPPSGLSATPTGTIKVGSGTTLGKSNK
jgi:hypothetical protein